MECHMLANTYAATLEEDISLDLSDIYFSTKSLNVFKKRSTADFATFNRFADQFDCEEKINFVNNVASANAYEIKLYVKHIIKDESAKIMLIEMLKASTFSKIVNKKNIDLRLEDYKFVKSVLKKLRGFYIQQYAMTKRLISAFCKYTSSITKKNFEETKEENQLFLENNYKYIKCKNVISKMKLEELVMTTKDKINDTYTDMLMTETIAKREKRVQFMLTFTAAPRFHSNPKFGDSSWDGSTSQESLAFIYEMYRTIYKRLHERGVHIFGISAVEPHEDGCAHLHVACFVREKDVEEFLEVKEAVRTEFCDAENVSRLIYNKETKQLENSSLIQVSRQKDDDEENRQSASSYLLKYVLKSFNDPEVAAFYSRDNGGEIRRVNKFGLKACKSKFNYIMRMKHTLLNHQNIKIRQLAKMMNDDTITLSEKKVRFYDHYADLIKIVYAERLNKYNEKVKGSIDYLLFADDFNSFVIKKETRALDEVKDAKEIEEFEKNDMLEKADFVDNKGHRGADAGSAASTAALVDLQRFANPGAVVIKEELTVVQCSSSGAGASPAPVITSEIDDFFDDFEDDEEQINLLDI